MAVYSILHPEELQDIANQYGLEIMDCSPVEGGYSNSNYKLKTRQGTFILTLFAEKSAQDVRQLLVLQDWLLRRRFPADEVIAALSGQKILEISGRPLILKKWINGIVVENLDAALLRQTGRALAQLHQISPPDYLPRTHLFGITSFPDALGRGIDPKYETWLAAQMKYLQQGLSYDLPKGLIHGDLFGDNILFDRGKLKAIIDFEYACFYPFIFDLALAAVANCAVDEKINKVKLRALIEGYEEVRHLEKTERSAFSLYMQYAATASSCWRFLKFRVQSPNPAKSNRHREMFRIAENIRNEKWLKNFIITL